MVMLKPPGVHHRSEYANTGNTEQILLLVVIFSPGTGVMSSSVLVRGADIINSGDWVALWVDRDTYRPRKLVFRSILEGEGVQAEVDYAVLPDGTAYAAMTNVQVPSKRLVQTTHNFGHATRSAAP